VKFDEDLQRHQDFDFFIRVNEVVQWIYFEDYDVIVYWDGRFNDKIDFNACVSFYKKHYRGSKDRFVINSYLAYISESCVKVNPSIDAQSFYKSELLKEGETLTLRQQVLFNFPMIFHVLYRIKFMFK